MRLLFIATEVALKNSPEGIVSRSLISGFVANNWTVDLIAPEFPSNINLESINKHFIVNTGFLLSKIRKKITGFESNSFFKGCCALIENLSICEYDLIFIRSDPISVHKIALFINDKFNIKCVCSFGDAGSVNPYYSQPGAAAIRRNNLQKLENKIIENGNIITQTNQSCIELYKKNGFDTSNFLVLANPITSAFNHDINGDNTIKKLSISDQELYNNILERCNRSKYNFVFLGSLYGDRKPDEMFKHLSQYENLTIHIFGGVRNILYEKKGYVYKKMKEKGINDIYKKAKDNKIKNVVIWPFMPMEVINTLISNQFDALINIDADFDPNPFLSSKIVQYLSYAKPIINYSNIGATTELLTTAGIQFFVSYNSPPPIMSINELLSECTPKVDIKYDYQPKNLIANFLTKITTHFETHIK